MREKGFVSIDFIKVLILWRIGGFYMDTDVTIVNSPIQLHYNVHMYGGLEEHEKVGMSAATIASIPKHKLIEMWYDLLKE